VTFVQADVMDVNLSEATLVFCYLITAASVALKPKLEDELYWCHTDGLAWQTATG
jgi:hypothetical protein